MNGPQHYAEAERLVAMASLGSVVTDGDKFAVAAAQVHATLALVASRVDATAARGPGDVNPDLLEVTT